MGKHIQVENFTYTLLDEGENAYSYEACHPLAIVRAPEKYDSLKLALQDIIDEVARLETTTERTYTIMEIFGTNNR